MAIFDDLPLDFIFDYLSRLTPKQLMQLQLTSKKFKSQCNTFFGRTLGTKDYEEGMVRLRALNKHLRELVLNSTYSLALAEKISRIEYSAESIGEVFRYFCSQSKESWTSSVRVNKEHIDLLKEGLVPMGALLSIIQSPRLSRKEYLFLKKIIERGLPSFRMLREVLTFEDIITLPSIAYYTYLLNNKECLRAIKNKWLLPEEFKKIELHICRIILNQGYGNNGIRALEKGLIKPALLVGVQGDSGTEKNLCYLLEGNAFKALEEGLIDFEEVIEKETEFLLLKKLSREPKDKLLNLIRKGKISLAKKMESTEFESSHIHSCLLN